jgi:hypothetical protein
MASGLALGLSDIDDDPSTQDGTLSTDSDFSNLLYTKHGLSFSGKHLTFGRRSGVLQAVTAPNCAGVFDAPRSLFRGVSAAFRTGARSGKAILCIYENRSNTSLTSQVLENGAILKGENQRL